MADAPAPNFTARSVRRISRVVRAAEREPGSLGGEPYNRPAARETIAMGRLLAKPTPGNYTWKEVRRKDDGTWVEKDGGRKGEADDALAVPMTGVGDADGVYATGGSTPPVMLKRSPVEQTDGTFKLRWVIVATPSSLRWGKLTALWVPGNNFVTLQPVKNSAGTAFGESPPTVSVTIIMPANRVPAYLLGEINDVFAYQEFGTDLRVLVNPQTTPIPVKPYEVLQNQGTSPTAPQWAADIMQGHNLP